MQFRRSTQVALGGIATALCLVCMFLTTLFPFTEFTFPAMAGAVLIAVVIENGVSTAVLVYAAVSILSLFLIPSKEAAVMFVGFFGFYPILKSKLERIRSRVLEYVIKLLVFNVSVVGSYLILIYVMGLSEILEETGPFGQYSVLVLLILGNIVFLIYDIAITRVVFFYINWFRPKILRKLFR